MDKRKDKEIQKQVQYNLKSKKGITLIALVISIIVMLILAGVSLNATIGENGIIAKARSTIYIQSCAELEEFFNQFYVQHYDELDKSKNKVEAIRGMHINWFYSTLSDEYVTDVSGHALYLLKKSEFLKDNPDYNLAGGDAGNGTYRDYYNLNDVYGVTSDLKVYYCSKGIETIYGVTKEELDNEDFGRIIINNDSNLSKIIEHSSENGVNVSEARNVSELVIDETSGISNLLELYKLSGLKKITIKNLQGSNFSLQGIENATSLNYICFYNCNLSDYSEISKLNKLNYLYLYNSNDSEVSKVFNAMKNTDYNDLQYLGIFGVSLYSGQYWYQNDSNFNSEVTNIDILSELTENTKFAVKYLYLNNNKITSVNCLSGFKNVENLLLNRNNLTDLSGLESMTNLYLLSVHCNKSLSSIDAIKDLNELKTFVSYSTDLLRIDALKNKEKMTYLHLSSNKNLQDVSVIANMSSMGQLYLAGCSNLTIESVKAIRYIYNKVDIYYKNIDSKYLPYLESDEVKNLASNNLTDSQIDDKLANVTEIEKLNLNYNTNLANTNFTSLNTELQNKIIAKLGNTESSRTNDAYFRYVLSTLTNMKYLTIRNISNLKSIDFVKYMPNLVELDLLGTGVTDLSVLEELKNNISGNTLSKFSVLTIDNVNIDLTKIQNTITGLYNKSGAYWSYTGDRNVSGLRIGNSELLTKKDTSLGCCDKVTRLQLSLVNNVSTSTYFDLSEMNSLKQYIGCYVASVVKLPSSVERCYQGHCNFPIFESSIENPSQLTYFDNDNSLETTQSALKDMFDSLETCQTTKEITLDIHSDFNVQNFDGLEKMKNCKFATITLNPWYATIDNLNVFSKFDETATGYIKQLTISGQRYNDEFNSKTEIGELPDFSKLNVEHLDIFYCGINNIGSLSLNRNIKNLCLNNNNIQNLEGLLEMKQLESISLAENNIYNTYNDAVNNKKVDNLEILRKISENSGNGYKVKFVNLQKNYLEENEDYINMKRLYNDTCLW